MGIREILNEMLWDPRYDFSRVEIWYLHRTMDSRETVRVVQGDAVIRLGKSFIETQGGVIPYHRVRKIVYGTGVVLDRTMGEIQG